MLRAGFAAFPIALLVFAVLAWLGPRLLWGQSWRANTHLAVASLPTCLAAQATGRAWAAELRAGNIDTRAAFWSATVHGQRMWDFLPAVWATDAVKTYGTATASGWDGTKRLYDVTPLAAVTGQRTCLIYSFGSNLQTEFEESMLRSTACNIFTFDCTVRLELMEAKIAAITAVSPNFAARFHFLPYCVGAEGRRMTMHGMTNGEGSTDEILRSGKSIMSELGHSRVDLIKMDTEGGEHVVIPDLARMDGPALPSQVNFELHKVGTAGSGLFNLFTSVAALVDVGYVLVSRDDNLVETGCCTELTFVLGCGRVY